MNNYNPRNERIKEKYFDWRVEAKGRGAPGTMNNIRKAIERYEQFTKYADFKKYNKKTAKAFKKHLAETMTEATGEPLSKAYISSTLYIIKELFRWISQEPGYRCIDPRDIEFLNLSDKDMAIACAPRRERTPKTEEIRLIIFKKPALTAIEKRDQAIIAGTFLIGLRDDAAASLPLKHVHLDDELVDQRGEDMRTKASKTMPTYFFPVGDDIKQIFIDWVVYLREVLQFTDDDPVFPQTNVVHDSNHQFVSSGLKPEFWANANPIRKAFKEACEKAGLKYYNPHSFRKALGDLGERVCETPEEFKAWSQNLGHDHVSTTFENYGEVPERRQREIMRRLKETPVDKERQFIEKLARVVKSQINLDQ